MPQRATVATRFNRPHLRPFAVQSGRLTRPAEPGWSQTGMGLPAVQLMQRLTVVLEAGHFVLNL
jgi:hypothetical protein